MELEELKGVWAQYDKKLSENLKFNEELLIKMNLDKSKREMSTPLNYEIGSFILSGIIYLYIISATIRFSGELKFFIPGILSVLSLSILQIFSALRIKLLSNIDFYNSSLIELQKSILSLRQRYLQFKKIEIYLFPFVAIFTFPILGIEARNFDFYSHPYRMIIGVILALVIGYPSMIWLYNHIYEKKLKNTASFLEELKRFEKEE